MVVWGVGRRVAGVSGGDKVGILTVGRFVGSPVGEDVGLLDGHVVCERARD